MVPDVIGVRKSGIVDAFEVQSTKDPLDNLLQRLEEGFARYCPNVRGAFKLCNPNRPSRRFMIQLVSEDCAALAFYGIAPVKTALADFYSIAVRWFADLGHPTDKVAVRGPSHPRTYQSFERVDRKLKSNGFEGIVSVELVSLAPEAKIPGQDYLLTAWASLKNRNAYIVSRTSIVHLAKPEVMPLAKKVILGIQPSYCIGYTRPHRLGPSMYAVGIAQGLGPDGYGIPGEMTTAEEAEFESISHWGTGVHARVWEKGLLRDVYPWNFLNRAQLEAEIADVRLEEWILKDRERGKLERAGDGIRFWQLEPEQIPGVRGALEKAELALRLE